jgi:hypothetical protein
MEGCSGMRVNVLPLTQSYLLAYKTREEINEQTDTRVEASIQESSALKK